MKSLLAQHPHPQEEKMCEEKVMTDMLE